MSVRLGTLRRRLIFAAALLGALALLPVAACRRGSEPTEVPEEETWLERPPGRSEIPGLVGRLTSDRQTYICGEPLHLRGALINTSDRYVPDPRHHYTRYRAWYLEARWLGRGQDDPDLRRARALWTDTVSGGYSPRHEPLLIPPGKGLFEEEVLQNPQVYRPGFWVFRWEWSGGEYRVATNDLIVQILPPPSPSPATPTPYDALRYLHPTSTPTPTVLPPRPTGSTSAPPPPPVTATAPPPPPPVTATAPPLPPVTATASPPPPPPPETLLPPLTTPLPAGGTELLPPLDFDITPLPTP